MKKFILLFFIISGSCLAQEEHAWVYFTDKANVTDALQNPLTILSEKAIARKELRNTPIDKRDVPINEIYINQLETLSGFEIMAKSKWMNCVHVIGNRTDIESLSQLEFVASIEFAGENRFDHSQTAIKKAETKLETAVDFEYGFSNSFIQMLDVNSLHLNDYTGKDLSIAVMDAGFPNVTTMGAFERLRNSGNLLGGYDFPNRSHNFNNPALSNHGTLVLSNMAAYVEDKYVGTAPDASYYLFITEIAPTETPVEESYWVEAAERADSLGVDMINTSLGYTLFDNSDYSYTPADMDGNTAFISRGANIAMEKGMLVVTSAGNRGDENYFKKIGAPADANVLSVGAVNADEEYAFFSSIGPTADGRIKPDVAAQGMEVPAINEFNQFVSVNGTSFSSPIMAGAVASFWQINPSWTNTEVLELVREISHLYENPNNLLGYGIPDFSLAIDIEPDTIRDPQVTDELVLYPNPVENILNFTNPNEIQYSIKIFSVNGQLLLNKELSNDQIDLSGFSRGIYIFMFELNNTTKSFLIIKK